MKFGAHLQNLVKRSFCGLFSFILTVGSVSTALPILVVDNIYAAGVAPTCTSGEITGGNKGTTFEITLNCSNLSVFDKSGSTSADQLVDLVNVTLHMNSWDQHPRYGNIDGDQLIFTFYYCPEGNPVVCPVDSYDNKDTTTRDLSIAAGVLRGETKDDLNVAILMTADEIIDKNEPYVVADDSHDSNETTLFVSAEQGLLSKVEEAEGSDADLTIVLVSGPSNGTLNLNPDGSFLYTRNSGNFNGDEFIYYITDGSSNNSNQATVKISDPDPDITGTMYRQDPGDPGKATIGDTVVVEIDSNEPIALDGVKIAGNTIIDYPTGYDTHFTLSYVMNNDNDDNGYKDFSIYAHDLSGIKRSPSIDAGVIFNKTPPVISLLGDDEVELGSEEFDYQASASALDALDDEVQFSVDGSVDVNQAGFYTLVYNATDSFGNQADPVPRQIQVVDTVSNDFDEYNTKLNDLGVVNNLDTVNYYNHKSFTGLYLDGENGRITFNNPIDMSREDIMEFILHIDQYIYSGSDGSLGLNLSSFGDDFPLRNLGATLTFRDLDKIGYNNFSTASDAFARLNIYDDEGQLIDKAGVTDDYGMYTGCGSGITQCYTYKINIKHFTKFVIGDYVAPPIVEKLPDFNVPVLIGDAQVLPISQILVNASKNIVIPTIVSRISTSDQASSDADQTTVKANAESEIYIQPNQKAEPRLNHANNFNIAWYWWLLATSILTGIVVWWMIRQSRS